MRLAMQWARPVACLLLLCCVLPRVGAERHAAAGSVLGLEADERSAESAAARSAPQPWPLGAPTMADALAWKTNQRGDLRGTTAATDVSLASQPWSDQQKESLRRYYPAFLGYPEGSMLVGDGGGLVHHRPSWVRVILRGAHAGFRSGALMAIVWLLFSCSGMLLMASRLGLLIREGETIGGYRAGKVWDAFFSACREQGVLEVERGCLGIDEIEAADPRVMLALPSIVLLRCLLGSAGKDAVVLPGGAELTGKDVGAKADSGRKAQGSARAFSRLLAAHAELKLLGDLTAEERELLELRALQADATPLGDPCRDAAVNRAAASVSAVATEVSQLGAFSRMGKVLEEIRKKVCSRQGQTEGLFPPPLAEEDHAPPRVSVQL